MSESENIYEARARRLAEHFEKMVPRLAERLRGGARAPFTVRLSRAEELARLAMMPDEAWAAMLAKMGFEDREAFLKHVESLVRST